MMQLSRVPCKFEILKPKRTTCVFNASNGKNVMATNMTLAESGDKTYLRVAGEMFVDDANLLEKLVTEVMETSPNALTIDLADLSFLDSESATVLKRIAGDRRITIEGIEIFLQSAIDAAERTARG